MIRLSAVETRVVIAVAVYRQANGEGPPWRWIRRELGVSHRQLGRLLAGLAAAGHVSFTPEPGSLATTPEATRVALAFIRDELGRERNAYMLSGAGRAGIERQSSEETP